MPTPAGKSRTFGNGSSAAEQLLETNVQRIAELETAAQARRGTSDVIADAVAQFCGSMLFVWVHGTWFAIWIVINVVPHIHHVDPFPFQLLTLVVSLEAIFLTTFIMISQNRQARLADRRNHLDLQINMLAEQENTKTITMLAAIMKHLKIDADPEVHALCEQTEPAELAEKIDTILDAPV